MSEKEIKNNIGLASRNAQGLAEPASLLVSRGLELARVLERRRPSRPKPFSISENTLGMRLVFIPPGPFMMGSPPDESGRKDDETWHGVTLTRGFYLQTTTVTVGQWRMFVQETGFKTRAEITGGAFVRTHGSWVRKKGCYWDNPGFEQSDVHPVTCISWEDAQAFVEWLDRMESRPYRLPTEAEWEHASRAGSEKSFCFGDDEKLLGDYAWVWENSEGSTHPVAQKKPNSWGLYDMHGNVWEMCEDQCGFKRENGKALLLTNTYRDAIVNPLCWEGPYRISRGGDWQCPPRSCRSAKRLICSPKSATNVRGFRVARNP
jgi:formylglycine-generating enzyme required for sulfatase activity